MTQLLAFANESNIYLLHQNDWFILFSMLHIKQVYVHDICMPSNK